MATQLIKTLLWAIPLLIFSFLLITCGEFSQEDDDDDYLSSETFDGKIPADWSGTTDYDASALKVADE